MNEAGSLFSGVGLLDYGLHLAGWRHRFFCEADEWRRGILARRWPGVPVHADVRRLSGDAVPRVDLLAGGFPCKGASTAGKREGFDHPETALWAEYARLIGELRPRYALLENVAAILALDGGRTWGTVLGDLAALGYDVWWDVFPAAAFGAPHRRERVFAVAYATEQRKREPADEAHPVAGGGEARSVAGSGGIGTAADTTRGGGQGTRPGREALGRAAGDRPDPPPDAHLSAVATGRDRSRADSDQAGAEAVADASGGPAQLQREPGDLRGAAGTDQGRGHQWERDGDAAATRAGGSFPWGDYESAIRRWEAIHGPAPLPLVRGVDARGSARVVRSRLSALGDGVQVQAGYLLGSMILTFIHNRERDAA